MRPEGPLLGRKADLPERPLQPLLKSHQPRHLAVHPQPDDPGPARVGKTPYRRSRVRRSDRRRGLPRNGRNVHDRIFGDVAEEFQGQVDPLRPDPAEIPADEFPQPVLNPLDLPEDLLRRIERQKDRIVRSAVIAQLPGQISPEHQQRGLRGHDLVPPPLPAEGVRTADGRLAAGERDEDRPPGFASVPPEGPAIPVTARPRSVPADFRTPSAIRRAVSALTAPCSRITASGTPRRAVLAALP